ncbi:MAG TPA: NAD(P)/FAD-dependent oxidoreductase [Thermoplasmata archaeon]|nr:NAD(P)/FAD-dependent oxidoreductase [Thermoplasmata archaeon]
MESPEVIIVGAGFAGLACAHALRQAGVPLVLLESKDRVGGRVRTESDLVPGHPVEGGAMMVHGSDASVLRWMEEFGLTAKKVPEFRGARFFLKGKLRSSLGVALSGLEPLRSSFQTLRKFPKAIARYDGPDITLDRFLEERHALPTAKRFVGAMYASINAADPEDVSVRGLAEDANVESLGLPWANYQVPEGYAEVAKRRAQEFGDSLRLCTRVEAIEWTKDGVHVRARGPAGPESFDGAAAVVTVSLGVLQADALAFRPGLPERKRAAIRAIGFGHADKILLVFDATVRRSVLGKATSVASTQGSWFFFPFYGRKEFPLVLEGFLSGQRALALSGRTEREVVDSVVRELESMIPGADLKSHLIAARYVDWSADPDVRGGYTFPKIGGGAEQRRILAEPVDGVLFFAGESTHAAGQYATVHGALDSGVRAAHEVRRSLEDRRLLTESGAKGV